MLFGTRNGNKFDWITYKQFEREVQKFRNVLVHHNFGVGDKIAVIVNNRVEWAVVAIAANTRGGKYTVYRIVVLYCTNL